MTISFAEISVINSKLKNIKKALYVEFINVFA